MTTIIKDPPKPQPQPKLTPPELMANLIVHMLLQYSEDDRAEIVAAVCSNDIFCTACGGGSPERPNSGCQCWNDD